MTASVCGSCGAPVNGAVLCTGCTGHLRAVLEMAASIAPDLDDAVARLLRRGDAGKSQRTEAPLPYDETAGLRRAELRLVLVSCARSLGRPAGTTARGSDGLASIADAARWLLAHLNDLRQHEAAADAHRGIVRAVARAVAVVDRRPERVPAGTCAQCGKQLLAELGADSVTCACGLRTDGIAEQRTRRAAAADVLGTPGEISGALYTLGIIVSSSTIRTWASRGRLAQRPGGTPERPVYAMSEVMSLCAKRRA